tara:strand:- start:268 stop:804 length:537 start_codon:yes stop_codon:yes gene_type:complete
MISKNLFSGVIHLEPTNFLDERGFFRENFNKRQFEEHSISFEPLQDNFSFSKKEGTIRGLHFQKDPYDQAKIIYVLAGSIFDVFLDIRKNSKTFGMFDSIKLSPDSGCIYIPKGFAHGFCTLEDNTTVMYKVDNYYNKDSESGIKWSDNDLSINWPKYNEYLISEKDKKLGRFKDLFL